MTSYKKKHKMNAKKWYSGTFQIVSINNKPALLNVSRFFPQPQNTIRLQWQGDNPNTKTKYHVIGFDQDYETKEQFSIDDMYIYPLRKITKKQLNHIKSQIDK